MTKEQEENRKFCLWARTHPFPDEIVYLIDDEDADYDHKVIENIIKDGKEMVLLLDSSDDEILVFLEEINMEYVLHDRLENSYHGI